MKIDSSPVITCHYYQDWSNISPVLNVFVLFNVYPIIIPNIQKRFRWFGCWWFHFNIVITWPVLKPTETSSIFFQIKKEYPLVVLFQYCSEYLVPFFAFLILIQFCLYFTYFFTFLVFLLQFQNHEIKMWLVLRHISKSTCTPCFFFN